MIRKRNLLRLSIALLVFNLILGVFAVYRNWSTGIEIAKAYQENNFSAQVLGVESSIPKFDKNFAISNVTFSSSSVFPTESSVQNYLEKVDSPLKNYVVDAKSASYWIFGAARGTTSSKYGVTPNINPALILTFLEKEQSLISLKNYDTYKDSGKRIKFAMGYGCPDNSACDSKYNGFVNQVNWAAYQLQFNYNNSVTGRFVAPYKVQNTITTLDEYNVFITNEATAAIYRYTPHVYWGAYNTWKIIVANGWGQSNSTYSYNDLDGANLNGKDVTVDLPGENNVDENLATNLLKTGCALGDSSNNIKVMQRYLRQKGYFMNREITGLCGTVTQRAIQTYFGKNDSPTGGSPEVVSNKTVYATSKGVSATGLNSRSEPCGPLADPTPINWGTAGAVLAGPTSKYCFGSNWNWYQIKWDDGSLGWSVSSYLAESKEQVSTPTPAAPNQANGNSTAKSVVTKSQGVNAPGLNLRAAACGTKIGVIPWSTKGTVIGSPVTKNCFGSNIQWIQVKFSNGKTGWVAANYLG